MAYDTTVAVESFYRLHSRATRLPVMLRTRLHPLLAAVCMFLRLSPIRAALYTLPEDGRLNFTGLAAKYGYPSEEHSLLTEDGYLLKLFHIPGDSTRPVLLMHGILDSADTFMIRGNTSMVAALARKGYDVWVGNTRGNRYSRNHVKYNPNTDPEFWDYSFHEIAIYDLSATIDYILNHTGQAKLSCMGHSQGNTIFYALGSIKPEYNDKIKIMIALAPICFLTHFPHPGKYVLEWIPLLSDIMFTFGQEEIFSDNSIEKNIFKTLCCRRDSYEFCGKGLMMGLTGSDPEELEPAFLPIAAAHYPSSTSRKSGTHLVQLSFKKTFSQMDYGVTGNLAAYNSTRPPNYDLSKVTMRIALLAGANDKLSSLVDVKTLRRRLPNVVEYRVLPWAKTNHLDFVWGRNMEKHLFPTVMSLLERFGDS